MNKKKWIISDGETYWFFSRSKPRQIELTGKPELLGFEVGSGEACIIVKNKLDVIDVTKSTNISHNLQIKKHPKMENEFVAVNVGELVIDALYNILNPSIPVCELIKMLENSIDQPIGAGNTDYQNGYKQAAIDLIARINIQYPTS